VKTKRQRDSPAGHAMEAGEAFYEITCGFSSCSPRKRVLRVSAPEHSSWTSVLVKPPQLL
jgi:hypothetical protein